MGTHPLQKKASEEDAKRDLPFAVRLLNGTVNIFAVCEIESMPWDCTSPVNIYSPTDYADAYLVDGM